MSTVQVPSVRLIRPTIRSPRRAESSKTLRSASSMENVLNKEPTSSSPIPRPPSRTEVLTLLSLSLSLAHTHTHTHLINVWSVNMVHWGCVFISYRSIEVPPLVFDQHLVLVGVVWTRKGVVTTSKDLLLALGDCHAVVSLARQSGDPPPPPHTHTHTCTHTYTYTRCSVLNFCCYVHVLKFFIIVCTLIPSVGSLVPRGVWSVRQGNRSSQPVSPLRTWWNSM